jgi:Uma2 family endonuclease
MSTATSPPLTTDDLLSFPEDGIDRWLLHGELREKPMTVRNRFHSRILVRVARFLDAWNDEQPEPRGEVLGGEAGVRLLRDPDSTVGIDVVYISPQLAAQRDKSTTLINGVPVLAVEILSPNDTQQEIDEKVELYLTSGVQAVWIINPSFETVVVLQPGKSPVSYNHNDKLSGEPYLPGFSVPVAKLLG